MTFQDWRDLIEEVIVAHARIVKQGGFMVVNIGDILCFPDPAMPRFQANNVHGKTSTVTREEVLEAKRLHPRASRKELGALLGCSEQTVQRRLEHNNVRGGKQQAATKVLLTGELLAGWAETAGLYLYDQRVWHKDPCWANSRWHSTSYRAVDEFEHVYVFWRPGIVTYDRERLSASEWADWGSRGVWRIRSVRKNDRHEAEFPEELATRVIRLFSPEWGVVLDPFVGSGTTTVVAKRLNRHWLGIESDAEYADIARRRMEDA
jgi:site-specific DNA-methyltransferase (adenine-specific)